MVAGRVKEKKGGGAAFKKNMEQVTDFPFFAFIFFTLFLALHIFVSARP